MGHVEDQDCSDENHVGWIYKYMIFMKNWDRLQSSTCIVERTDRQGKSPHRMRFSNKHAFEESMMICQLSMAILTTIGEVSGWAFLKFDQSRKDSQSKARFGQSHRNNITYLLHHVVIFGDSGVKTYNVDLPVVVLHSSWKSGAWRLKKEGCLIKPDLQVEVLNIHLAGQVRLRLKWRRDWVWGWDQFWDCGWPGCPRGRSCSASVQGWRACSLAGSWGSSMLDCGRVLRLELGNPCRLF